MGGGVGGREGAGTGGREGLGGGKGSVIDGRGRGLRHQEMLQCRQLVEQLEEVIREGGRGGWGVGGGRERLGDGKGKLIEGRGRRLKYHEWQKCFCSHRQLLR